MSNERPERLLADSSNNTKLRKSEKEQYRIVSLSLSPADEAGTGKSNCQSATAGCLACCVGSPRTGMAQVFSSIMHARAARTRWLQEDRDGFLQKLSAEIDHEQRKAAAQGKFLVVRLNCFSDIPYESSAYSYRSPRNGTRTTILDEYPDVIFYDYTKHGKARVINSPRNYHITKSWSENPAHQRDCLDLLRVGRNIAAAFADSAGGTGWKAYDQKLPGWIELGGERWRILDGDDSDLRFEDQGPSRAGRGSIIGLRLKAGSAQTRAIAIETGFSFFRD